jgi:tetratricopeptide (TPR) repeat protein
MTGHQAGAAASPLLPGRPVIFEPLLYRCRDRCRDCRISAPVAVTQVSRDRLSAADLALLKRAQQLRQQGFASEAADLYRQLLQGLEQPAVELFFHCGNALFDAGRHQEALSCFQSALLSAPDMESAALQAARCALQLGDHQQALLFLEQVLARNNNHFTAHLELGNLFRRLANSVAAEQHYRRAVQLDTQRHEGHLALARLCEEVGEVEEGAIHYHLALVACAGKPEAVNRVHWQMAGFRLERGEAAAALEAMRQALLVSRLADPGLDANLRAEQQITLGEILMRLGLQELAHRAFERASAATAEDTLVRLAETSFRFNLWQEAQEVLQRNLQLHPNSAMARWNLAHLYVESWQLQEAETLLREAEAIMPVPGAASMRASIAGRLGDADGALALYRQLALAPGGCGSPVASSAAMASLYSDRLSATEVSELHRELCAPLGEGARPAHSFANARDPHRPLRLGLVSADFHHQHPVNLFMQPVLDRLNRHDWQVTIYFTGGSVDEQTRQARRRVEQWRDVAHCSDQRLAQWIEADGIDILMDLAGHTSNQRCALFAQRAAPVQVTYLGYPGSTGIPNIDWILADSIVAPATDDALFSERVARFPHTVFCYHPEVDYPYPNYDQRFLDRPLTFGSFNNAVKLTPASLRVWSQILRDLPEARLLLKAPSFKDEGAVRHFQERFAAAGISADRLEFRGPVGLDLMMAEYADVDIALDPFPYNGGTTSHQALWMGVPVISLRGRNFVSRMGASLLTAAGLEDWIAADERSYRAIAIAKGRDRQALLDLKAGLREQLLQRPGWKIDDHVRAMEILLRGIWHDWLERDARARHA